MCQAASAMGQEISLHNPVGPVLDAVSRHVAAALPGFLTLERPVRETPLWNALRGGPAKMVNGAVEVETLGAAGLGLALDTGLLRQQSRDAGQSERALSFKGMAGAGPDA
jgi:galactonate dehydratase